MEFESGEPPMFQRDNKPKSHALALFGLGVVGEHVLSHHIRRLVGVLFQDILPRCLNTSSGSQPTVPLGSGFGIHGG